MPTKSLFIPASVKADLLRLAAAHGYPAARTILARGTAEELVVDGLAEAQVVANVARVEMMSASLKSPFWDEEDPRHDARHEEAFHEVVNGLFEKTISALRDDFDITTKI